MTPEEKWIQQHFEELVEKYAGNYVAVAGCDLTVGKSLLEVREKAIEKHPDINPSILRVPRPEDFLSAL
jgi:hypothetical protein